MPPAAAPAARSTRIGWIYLCAAVANYAGLWPIMRVAALQGAPLWFGAWRMTTGFVAVVVLLAAIGQLRRPSRQDWPAILTVGVLMIGVYLCLAMVGLQYVGAGRATLLGYTTPLWVTPFSVLVMGERLTRLKVAGLALGLAGLVILFNPADFDWSDGRVIFGNALLMLTAVCWAIPMLYLRVHRWNLTALQLVPWQVGCAVIVTNLGAVVFEGDRGLAWTGEMVGLMVLAGPVMTLIGIWAMNGAMGALSPITASIAFLSTPVLALALGVVLLDEPLTASLVAGFAAIIAGIVCVTLAGAPPARRPDPG